MATTTPIPTNAPGKGTIMALEKELATYERKLPELKGEHEGKFVLIKGDEVIDFFSAYDDAIKAGYARFGLDPFLVKQIKSMEQAQFISRCIEPVGAAEAK